jgi:hypothetical protein
MVDLMMLFLLFDGCMMTAYFPDEKIKVMTLLLPCMLTIAGYLSGTWMMASYTLSGWWMYGA